MNPSRYLTNQTRFLERIRLYDMGDIFLIFPGGFQDEIKLQAVKYLSLKNPENLLNN